MNQKELFYNTLKDVFIGAKIEGNSGYVNLMRIKNKYYEKLKPELQKTIDSKFAGLSYNSTEEMYNKLYTFFHKYFSESGAIYFTQTALQDKIYEKIYKEDKDVALFWKTSQLYYIKTERLFVNVDISFEKYNFHFDVANLEHKKNNEKKELVFELTKAESAMVEKSLQYDLYLQVSYAVNGAKTKIEEMPKIAKKYHSSMFVSEAVFEKAIAMFKKQNEVDYFINKNAKQFLKEQFAHYIKGYFLDDETIFEPEKLHQMKNLQHVAYKIIDVVSQFEDELVKVWNKPKFAHSANYVITADKIAAKNMALLQQIFEHKNIELQLTEWKELGILNENSEILQGFKNLVRFDNLFLPIDTKYFKDLELQILALFEDLETEIDGWLIHSENYQALNTLKHKFKEKIQTIYIDPPYNTKNDEFMYKDTYKHSSWLTLMENRLELARNFLKDSGSIFVSLDDNEQAYFKILCDNIFGENNFIASIIWYSKYTMSNDAKYVSYQHENINFYVKDIDNFEIGLFERTEEHNEDYKNRDNDPKGNWKATPLHAKSGSENNIYTITFDNGYTWTPPKGRYPRYAQAKLLELYENGELYFNKSGGVDKKTYLSEVKQGITVGSVWHYEDVGHTHFNNEELANLMGKGAFDNPKGTKLIEKIASVSKFNDSSTILDFFGGSGTTAHATIELNKKDEGKRKYLLVEVGSHFDTVIIPRLKKISFSDKWKDGKAQENGKGVSQFFKYFSLEQYEETLQKSRYIDTTNVLPDSGIYQEYLFLKDLKLADGVVNIEESQEKITVDLTALHPAIDIAETLSQLTGKFIKQIRAEEVVFADGTSMNFKNLDYKVIKSLIWW